jgi:uncharacterized protein (DUF1697 family)
MMGIYIAMLRGINVGGKRIIKMEVLKKIFSDLEFQNIQTYIQSGNIIFQSKSTKIDELQEKISSEILKTLFFEVPVIVKDKREFDEIILNNPFLKDKTKKEEYFHISFLSKRPNIQFIEQLKIGVNQTEEFQIINQAIYLFCPNGYSNSKLTNGFIENKLGVIATTRNWKTVIRIQNLSNK